MSKITKRKFLKTTGIASLGIVSLRSGAAFAATSNMQCEANDQKLAQMTNPDPLIDSETFSLTDAWVRIRTPIRYIRNVNDSTDEFWLFEDPSNSGSWYSEDTNTLNGSAFIDSGLGTMSRNGMEYDVIINNFGDVIGIYDPSSKMLVGYGLDQANSNITQSCYASIVNSPL